MKKEKLSTQLDWISMIIPLMVVSLICVVFIIRVPCCAILDIANFNKKTLFCQDESCASDGVLDLRDCMW